MKIESLTEAQVAKMPEFAKKWIDIGLSTGECDMVECVDIVKEIYKKSNLETPKYFLGPFNNPLESAYAETLVDKYCDGKRTSAAANKAIMKEVATYFANPNASVKGLSIENQMYGSMDATWLCFYDYFLEEFNLEECKPLEGLIKLSKKVGWWTALEDAVLLQHRPKAIHFDDRNRIHNEKGAAIEFRGSEHCNVYAIHGVIVTKDIVKGNFKLEDIEKQTNIEVRRVMIDIYGKAKYILDSGAQKIHSDDFGDLYVKKQVNDVDIMMVKVVNSTQEPDGTFKDYWIRVDPNAYGGVKTARAAVASTWRNDDGSLLFKTPEEYDPEVET